MIQGSEQNIKITSVVLESNPQEPDMMQGFFCLKCGDILGQYIGGNIIFIAPGKTEAKLPWVVYCRKCKTRYLINSIA